MPEMELDQTDFRILALLQDQGRLSNVEVAERVALSPSPCLRRIKLLEQNGIIRSYRAVLNRNKVGLGLTVFVDIKVERHTKNNTAALQAALNAIPEVVSCHLVSGSADFVAEVVVKDLQHYETLLTEQLLVLPMISDIRSNFSIRRIKSDGALPLEY